MIQVQTPKRAAAGPAPRRSTLQTVFGVYSPDRGWVTSLDITKPATKDERGTLRVLWGSAIGCRYWLARSEAELLCVELERLGAGPHGVMGILIEAPLQS